MTEKGKTTGAAVLTWEPPILTIEGRGFKVRRLGLLDIQRIAKIYAAGSEFVNRKALANMNTMAPEEVGTFILDFLPYAFDQVIDLFADLIGLAPGKSPEKLKGDEDNDGTIRDPNIFPLGAEVQVVEALIEHEDVMAFFDRVKAIAKSPALKKLTERLKGPSTASKPATAGKTKKS